MRAGLPEYWLWPRKVDYRFSSETTRSIYRAFRCRRRNAVDADRRAAGGPKPTIATLGAIPAPFSAACLSKTRPMPAMARRLYRFQRHGARGRCCRSGQACEGQRNGLAVRFPARASRVVEGSGRLLPVQRTG